MSLSLALDWDMIRSAQKQVKNTVNSLCPVRHAFFATWQLSWRLTFFQVKWEPLNHRLDLY